MDRNKALAEQTIVVILAAGKGTRMGRPDLGKVCFDIDAVPAVNRIITCFKKQRFKRFLLVVGSKAEQVLEVVAQEHPGVMCVYQQPQLGTGHAAKMAAQALQDIAYDGNALVTMGENLARLRRGLFSQTSQSTQYNEFLSDQVQWLRFGTIPNVLTTHSEAGGFQA